jgi:hypothetical protein
LGLLQNNISFLTTFITIAYLCKRGLHVAVDSCLEHSSLIVRLLFNALSFVFQIYS